MPDNSDEIDLLIATDCISEGQNLQDCDYLINYDIHWNPVRIIQRFGRIDRIGSKNASIQLVNYWPDISLDEYIRLKERVESRMVIADVSATGDDNPLDGRANDLAYRREQLRRMQEEVIELEDLKAGVSITDLGLNDFRMDLLNYLKSHDDLAHLPTGTGSTVSQTFILEPRAGGRLTRISAGNRIPQSVRDFGTIHPQGSTTMPASSGRACPPCNTTPRTKDALRFKPSRKARIPIASLDVT
jgi:hypothetical protein